MMDSSIFWKEYTLKILEEKLSSLKTDSDRLNFIMYAISEFNVFGIEDVIKYPVKFPGKYNHDAFERYHFYAQLKLSYRFLISKKEYYQHQINNNQIKDDSNQKVKEESAEILREYLKEHKISKRDMISGKVRIQPLAKRIFEWNPSCSIETYRQGLMKIKNLKNH